jgi:glycosyltransferase involved in cell wall biosynthesis
MKVLLQGRGASGERRGGDSTLSAELAGQLTALGHEVVVATAPPPEGLRGFDVVHAVNLDRSVLGETERLSRAALSSGCRLVVTPLWWPLDDFARHLALTERLAFRVRGWGLLRAVHDRRFSSLAGVFRRQRAVLRAATVVCPSGPSEADMLRRAFGPLPLICVHFGTARAPGDGGEPRAGVVCVGRLDPRKNQLGLIRALRGTGFPLRLIGTGAVFPDYARRCREEAGEGVELAGFLPDAAVEEALRRARVHALPSFFELPGLTSLDAAACGTAVVASRAGTAGDYFGDQAFYCGTDPESIGAAVLAANAAGPPAGLAERVASRFTWRQCAEGYLAAYAP